MTKPACKKKSVKAPEQAVTVLESLGWHDSCDADARGSEKALVLLLPPSGTGELQLCAHHFNKLEAVLVADLGWEVNRDIRHILTDKN